jgi:predicted enzyme related to lactoylglutathione lyase
MPKITGSNVTIMVKDMDKAISFYEQIGLTLKQRWGNHYAMVSAEGITIGIHPTEATTETRSGSVSIGFMVEAIDEAKALLDKHNITYKEENDGKSGLYLHFKDPDNTILYYVKPMW